MSDTEGEGFTIKDKRSSHQSEEEAKATDESQEKEQAARKEAASQAKGKEFELNFSTFVLSLTSSAFYHLGDIPDPMTGKKEENLPAVKQTIDILIMLQQKTKNNLDAEEAKLMEQLIYELQIKYVAKTKK
ncbi:MAG: DUF1844 domain-containing protein [Nitrospinota bacterium]|nr:DUF1844 domain-containing protein [Nitrospinota bacterium]